MLWFLWCVREMASVLAEVCEGWRGCVWRCELPSSQGLPFVWSFSVDVGNANSCPVTWGLKEARGNLSGESTQLTSWQLSNSWGRLTCSPKLITFISPINPQRHHTISSPNRSAFWPAVTLFSYLLALHPPFQCPLIPKKWFVCLTWFPSTDQPFLATFLSSPGRT